MSLPVDSSSQPAHDHEPGGAEVAGQAACDLTAIRGAGACAHDCDSRATQQLQRAGAAQEEARRWIVDRAKERRERRLRASDEAKATLREPPQLRRAVEGGLEAREPRAPRLGDQVRLRCRCERGECELVDHAASSFGER